MNSLILVHRTGATDFPKEVTADPQSLLWTTCLRKILFCLEWPEGLKLLPTDEVYRDHQAAGFLLEVICGLHSPILGETEVQGQFRQFIAETQKQNRPLIKTLEPLINQVLAESKKIREKHLCGTGSQSYGSLVRRLTSGMQSVSLIGSGQLVEEILPWLSGIEQVTVYARSPEKALRLRSQRADLRIQHLNELRSEQALLIAAPVEDDFLINRLGENPNPLDILIDLRGGDYRLINRIPGTNWAHKFMDLTQFMTLFEEQSVLKQNHKTDAMNAVKGWVLSQETKAAHRPFGWEDLCL